MGDMEKQTYFKEALSDFVFDVGSGRAIRHLTDLGYTTAQILNHLHYPVPEMKVKETVYRYLLETGILIEELPIMRKNMTQITMSCTEQDTMYSCLQQKISLNGIENSYISCPFGCLQKDADKTLQNILSPLTTREREYILGIAWETKTVFHRLDRRMLEIGIQLAARSDAVSFSFIKTKENIRFIPDSDAFV